MGTASSAGAWDTVSLLYGCAALLTLVVVLQRGRGFWRGPLAQRDVQLAWAVGFFLILPFEVFVHEFGHALAIWSVGGHVAELRWHVYWGLTVPVGAFSALQNWWIALAGNLAGLLIGAVLVVLALQLRRAPPALGHALFVAGTTGILFTLVMYPLLTLGVYFESDWKTIYDFRATPIASAATLAGHACLLVALWRSWRWLREADWAICGGHWPELARLWRASAQDPRALVPRRQITRLFLRGGRPAWAAESASDGLRALGPLTRGTEIAADSAPELLPWLGALRGIALAATGRVTDALETFSKLEEPARSDPAVRLWHDRVQLAAAERGLTRDAPPRPLPSD